MPSKQSIEEYAVSLPFSVGANGAVVSTTDQSKIWQDRVLSAIGTALGERILNYSYGSGIYQSVYSTQEDAVKLINDAVYRTFNVFLPLLTLVKVKTAFSADTGVLSIEIVYELPNSKIDSVAVGNVSLNGQLPSSEDI